MMKQLYLCTFFFIISLSSISAENSSLRIAIYPVVNKTENDVYEPFCIEINEIMEFNLRLIGNYEIIQESQSHKNQKEYMKSNNIDRLLMTSLNEIDGQLNFEINLYRQENEEPVFYSIKQINRFLDIFSITDNMILEMLSFLKGHHIAYSSVQLKNTGEDGEYFVTLNDIEIDHLDGYLENILIGEYNLKIYQKRFGKEKTLFDEEIRVNEGEQTECIFQIPYLTQNEKNKLDTLQNIIENEEVDIEEYQKAVLELLSLFSTIEFCPTLLEEKKRFDKLIITSLQNDLPNFWFSNFKNRIKISPILLDILTDLTSQYGMHEEKLSDLFRLYSQYKRIEAAGALTLANADEALRIYDDLMKYNLYYEENYRKLLIEEFALIKITLDDMNILRLKKRNIAVPIILGSLSTLFLGSSVTIDISDIINVNYNEIQELYTTYSAETDSNQLSSLHDKIIVLEEENYILESVKITGYICGSVLGAGSLISSFFVKNALDKKQVNRFENIFGTEEWILGEDWALNRFFKPEEETVLSIFNKSKEKSDDEQIENE